MIVIIALLVLAAFGCNTSKHTIAKTASVDSSYIRALQDSTRTLRSENAELQRSINELLYAGIYFDTVFINKHDTITNTVVIKSDGSISASGKISSAYVSKSVMQNILELKQVTIDSFTKALSEEKLNVKTQYKDVVKEKKVTAYPLWLIIAAVIFALLYLFEMLEKFQPKTH